MSRSYNNAAVLERPISTLVIETYPRFVLTTKGGDEFLLDADHRPLFRRRPGLRGELVDAEARLPSAAALRDMWINGANPLHDKHAAFEVVGTMRRWG